jgi:hypothetical protein
VCGSVPPGKIEVTFDSSFHRGLDLWGKRADFSRRIATPYFA